MPKLNANTNGYAASLVIKNRPGTLYQLTGYNSNAGAQFVQLHDAKVLPAEAAVPVISFTVAGVSNFSLDLGQIDGRVFDKGIILCNSSTGPTKTIGSADILVDAQYK